MRVGDGAVIISQVEERGKSCKSFFWWWVGGVEGQGSAGRRVYLMDVWERGGGCRYSREPIAGITFVRLQARRWSALGTASKHDGHGRGDD